MSDQPHLVVASNFWQRLRGLMWTKPLPVGQGLLITRCASVHTLFMRFPLDVVYLDLHGVVVKLAPQLLPWRLSWGGYAASQTLEMTAGGIAHFAIAVGDRLSLPIASEQKHAKN